MFFTGWSISWVAGVLATALTALFVLQLLALNARRQAVVTILFWRESLAAPPAVTLFDRFRRPLTFLFLAILLGMLALALLGPHRPWKVSPIVIVVDAGHCNIAGSAAVSERWSAIQKAFTQATGSAADDQQLAVIVSTSIARLAVGFDDPKASATHALDGVVPFKGAVDGVTALRHAELLLQTTSKQQKSATASAGQIIWITDANAVPPELEEARQHIVLVRVPETNIQPSLAGVAFLRSGPASQSGKVRVTVNPGTGQEPAIIRSSGITFERTATTFLQGVNKDELTFLSAEMVADGRRLSIQLFQADEKKSIDELSWNVPRFGKPQVRILGDVPLVIKKAMDALATSVTDAATGVVTICTSSEGLVDGPAIIIVREGNVAVPAGGKIETLEMGGPADQLDFESARCCMGPDVTAFGRAIIKTGNFVLAASSLTSSGERLYLSEALVGNSSEAPQRAAFLVLLARSLDSMSQARDETPVIPIGRQFADPIWQGRGRGEGVDSLNPRVVTSDLSQAVADVVPSPTQMAAATLHESLPQPFELMLSAALVLLVIDAILHTSGRIA